MICLKTYSKYDEPSIIDFTVEERLPAWIESPCRLCCSFLVTRVSDYYLLKFTLSAKLSIVCQRCLAQDAFDYTLSGEVALCFTDARADELMSCYDCVVVEGDMLDLEAIIVDELHLSSPQIPHEQCKEDIALIIQ